MICLLGTGRFGRDNCGVSFFASLGVSGWMRASERFLVVLRERREDFLIPTASFESSGLDFWWGDVATGVRDVRRGGGD